MSLIIEQLANIRIHSAKKVKELTDKLDESRLDIGRYKQPTDGTGQSKRALSQPPVKVFTFCAYYFGCHLRI